MAKFQPKSQDKLSFNVLADAPTVHTFIPIVECSVASAEVVRFEQAGKVATEYMLILLQHLSDNEIAHDPECPYHRSQVKDQIQNYYDRFMESEH